MFRKAGAVMFNNKKRMNISDVFLVEDAYDQLYDEGHEDNIIKEIISERLRLMEGKDGKSK